MTTIPWWREKVKVCYILIGFSLGSDRPRIFFRVRFTFSILTPFFLPSSLSPFYFIFAVPMRQRLGRHSCLSSPFPYPCHLFSGNEMIEWSKSCLSITDAYNSLFPLLVPKLVIFHLYV